MEPEIDPGLVAAFGSETRVRALAVLAGAFRPMTAYRVAKVGHISLPKTYEEIARLARAGLVARKESGWVLIDRDIRSLLRKRVRIRWSEDVSAERESMEADEAAFLQRLEALPPPHFEKGWHPRAPGRRRRDPRKDELLREAGLRTSVHG